MFRESVLHCRLAIPVTGFYEWNQEKEKVTFVAADNGGEKQSVLYLAGFYGHFAGEDRFVILTTAANASMKDVHDRMPLLLEEEEMKEWLLNRKRLEELLHKVPEPLQKKVEYEQQKLMF